MRIICCYQNEKFNKIKGFIFGMKIASILVIYNDKIGGKRMKGIKKEEDMYKRRLITFDWAMKKLLRSKANYEILEGFLTELLKEDIKIQEILESESNKENCDDKCNKVDLKVKNSKDEIIIIEIQYNEQRDYFHRILYGTSKSITEHINMGDEYFKVTKVISINILYFDLGHGKDYIYHGVTDFRGIHEKDILKLSKEQQEIFKKEKISEIYPEYYLLKVNNFNDIAKDSLDEWIYFLKNGDIKEKFKAKGLKKAERELEVLNLSEAERIAYDRYIEDRRQEKSMSTTNFMAGEAKGKKEGIKIGEYKAKLETAKNMLKKGMDISLISEITGLSIKEIEEIN
jgi:predicted transposase/invertase (TIGR01784 family)